MRNNFPCFVPTVITIVMLCVLTVTSLGMGFTHEYSESSGGDEVVSDTTEDDKREPIETIETIETVVETATVETSTTEVIFETEEPVTTEPMKPVESVMYYDVPLSESLQDHIFTLCENRGITPTIIIGIIETESRYRADVIGDSGSSLGLMQIQPQWHYGRMEEFGCSDLLNPFDNVTVGIDIFADLYACSGSIEWALMAYNGGAAYADRMVNAGVVSDYAYKVLGISGGLESYASIR